MFFWKHIEVQLMLWLKPYLLNTSHLSLHDLFVTHFQLHSPCNIVWLSQVLSSLRASPQHPQLLLRHTPRSLYSCWLLLTKHTLRIISTKCPFLVTLPKIMPILPSWSTDFCLFLPYFHNTYHKYTWFSVYSLFPLPLNYKFHSYLVHCYTCSAKNIFITWMYKSLNEWLRE